MAVVKADGYGHGAVQCAQTLEKAGCTFFAVFTIAEALELRTAGIKGNIMVFSCMEQDFLEKAVTENIILNVSSPNDIELLKSFHKRTNTCPEFHLKVDTGMSRLGVSSADVCPVFNALKVAPHLSCTGIYSHYATADEGDLGYAHWQLEQFERILSRADELELDFTYRHFSNSGSFLNLSESTFDIVRVGMLLYGAFPSDEVPTDLNIKPVMEFRGPIVSIRRVKAGTKVSYGGVWSAERDTTIGVVQTGFADGFPRPWYDGGYVVCNGKPYLIAGRVCMDQFMIDLGDDELMIGAEVLIFGQNGNDSLHLEEIAQHIHSTPYVLATAIHGRTERIYLK